MDYLEQKACDQANQAMIKILESATDDQKYDILMAAGCDIPKELQYLNGYMRCCGHVVLEGDRCPTCGDKND